MPRRTALTLASQCILQDLLALCHTPDGSDRLSDEVSYALFHVEQALAKLERLKGTKITTSVLATFLSELEAFLV